MSLHAFNAGCNILALRKNAIDYGMCCSWAQMIDYDKLSMLLGAQSRTGKILAKGDVVGVSALAEGQESLAEKIGTGHSGSADKFAGIPIRRDGSAILIPQAKVKMVCEVMDLLHLPGIEDDTFVLLKVLSHEEHADRKFLSADWF
jgi:flavin reductase (DIM6/NTAB) family NADH-FMN oxidoreductase RutF